MMGNKTVSERLNAKTLDQMFVNMVEQGYECPPFVSNSVDRYLSDFDRVRFYLKKGISVKETAFATQLSKSLVVEYADLIEELQGGEKE